MLDLIRAFTKGFVLEDWGYSSRYMFSPRSIPAKVCRRLLRMAEDLEQGSVSRYRQRYADCFETVRMLRKLVPGSLGVVYDIGASRGHWAQTLHAFFPDLREAVLFEPTAECQQELHALRLPDTQVLIHQVALGEKAGRATLYGRGPSASLMNATLQQEHYFPGRLPPGSEIVVVKTLDEIVSEQKLPLPDLIKLDVQGFEEQVLRGGAATLVAARWLVVELSVVELYDGQRTAGAVLAGLEQAGWRLAGIGYQWKGPNGGVVQFDAILVRE